MAELATVSVAYRWYRLPQLTPFVEFFWFWRGRRTT